MLYICLEFTNHKKLMKVLFNTSETSKARTVLNSLPTKTCPLLNFNLMRVFTIVFILIQFSLNGQDYFYVTNNTFGRTAVNYQCLEHENRIFTFTSRLCEFRECSTVSEVDAFGKTKWTLELPNTDLAPQSSCIYNDTFYVSGNYSPGVGITSLHKISMDGILQNSFFFSDPQKKIDRSLIQTLTRFKEKFIITGQAYIGEQSKGIVISIDGSMSLDTIIIDTTLENSTVWNSYVGPDSLLTCFYHQVNKFWPNQVRRIIKYDTDFNQVWSYTSDTLGVNTSFPYGTVLRDGRIAFVDFKPLQNTGLNSLRCLDTITKINDWMFSYQNVQSWGRKLRSVKQLRNGDIICTGEYTTKATEPRIEGSPYMMRVDSIGKLLWERAYIEIAPDGEDKGGNLWDVIELYNGDLMAVGFVTNNNKWDPLIIRTDHRGCMDDGNTNCPTVRVIDLMSGSEDVISGDKTIKIFPNPTENGVFNIELPSFIEGDEIVSLVYNMYGQIIQSNQLTQKQTQIEIPNVPSGMYLVQIMVNNSLRHSSKLVVR